MSRLQPSFPARGPRRQRGAMLIVGLIMLLLVTLIVVAAIRMSTVHVQVVGNEQFRTEAGAAAHYALDLVINNENFVDANLSANPVSINVSDDGQSGAVLTASYTDPECTRYRYIKKRAGRARRDRRWLHLHRAAARCGLHHRAVDDRHHDRERTGHRQP